MKRTFKNVPIKLCYDKFLIFRNEQRDCLVFFPEAISIQH